MFIGRVAALDATLGGIQSDGLHDGVTVEGDEFTPRVRLDHSKFIQSAIASKEECPETGGAPLGTFGIISLAGLVMLTSKLFEAFGLHLFGS